MSLFVLTWIALFTNYIIIHLFGEFLIKFISQIGQREIAETRYAWMHEWYHRFWFVCRLSTGACRTGNIPLWNTIALWPPARNRLVAFVSTILVYCAELPNELTLLFIYSKSQRLLVNLYHLNGDSFALLSFFTKFCEFKMNIGGICYTCSRWLISDTIYRDLSATDSCHCLNRDTYSAEVIEQHTAYPIYIVYVFFRDFFHWKKRKKKWRNLEWQSNCLLIFFIVADLRCLDVTHLIKCN